MTPALKFILIFILISGCKTNWQGEQLEDEIMEPDHVVVTKDDWDTCCRLCKRGNMASIVITLDYSDTIDCICKDRTQIVIRRPDDR